MSADYHIAVSAHSIFTIDSIGEQIISAGASTSCNLCNIESGPVRSFEGHSASVKVVKTLDDTLFASGARDGKILVWDLRQVSKCFDFQVD